jgi:hypothetical protein
MAEYENEALGLWNTSVSPMVAIGEEYHKPLRLRVSEQLHDFVSASP